MTTSAAQIAANIRNARHSTGPKTAQGKAISAKNAMRHGLLSTQALLPDEDPTQFETFATELRNHLDPQGPLEGILVDQIIGSAWKLGRGHRIEASVFAREIASARTVLSDRRDPDDPISKLDADVDRLLTGQAPHRTGSESAQTADSESDREAVGLAFIRDANGANAVSKLTRYQVSAERTMYKAMHELERVQARRRGQSVSPPVAVDVSVSGQPD